MTIVVGLESWNKLWPECRGLMHEHWKEVRENRAKLPFEVDWETAARLEEAGLMFCCSARDDETGELVGYLIWFVTASMESKGNLLGTLGPFFVLPSHEGIGQKLWNTGIKRLREYGAKTAYVHYSSFGRRSGRAKKFFEYVGGKPYEVNYEIVLGDQNV